MKILVGNCQETLKTIPDESVNCCITSPPYFGLRDYGVDGQIGLEQTVSEYIDSLRMVFKEVHRILKKDGTLWLNLGDSYAGSGSPGGDFAKGKQGDTYLRRYNHNGAGLKPKDLIGIPWRVALALQADGWYLRSDIIWHKPNPMPESVKDRPTKSHEYIFLLSKSKKYFYNSDAVKEPLAESTLNDNRNSTGKHTHKNTKYKKGKEMPSWYRAKTFVNPVAGRNRRSVWKVSTKSYKGAHFAVFPPDLIEPCVLAGCPVGGIILDPFAGSGTTAGVAIKHGRDAVICELNPDYVEIIQHRIFSIAGEPRLPL